MRRFAQAGMIAIMAVGAMAQQPGPWSEQLPQPQRPAAQGQYPQGPPQYQGQPGPPSGLGPNVNPNAGPTDDQGNAPDRGVARVSFMNGNVSVRRGDSGELVAAVVNAPLVAGDRVVTSDTGRAEVQFDFANLVRLGASTEVRLSELAYHRYQIQIATGTTIFRVVRETDAQVEISTPSVAVRPTKAGVYRVSVLPDGSSQITVRLGDAEVFSPRGSEPLHMGQTMVARGPASDPEFQLSTVVPDDEFERWCISRDRLLEKSPSSRHISPDVAGTQDLDANGRWVNDDTYGNVWAPTVDPGWAPYSCGRWTWLDYYGWSWVGCESWGWAPYHYGRWYHASFGWAWWPGPAYGPYYWRPAMVGFFGWGGGVGLGVGFGFGFGNIGWVPLGPGEFFHPWYGAGFYGGFRGANVANVNAMTAFRNARFGNAVSSVRAGDFGRGGVSSANMVRAQAGDLARAGAVRGQLPMTPSRESTQFSNHAASAQGMPHTSNETHFASHMQTSQTNRMSFDQQRQGMAQGISRGVSGAGGGFNGGSSAGAARTGAGSSSGSSWQHFDPSAGRGAGSSAAGGGIRQGVPPSSSQVNGGYRGGQPGSQQGAQSSQGRSGYSQPPARGYSQQQSVRINPPIVQNRGSSGSSGSTSSGSSGSSRPPSNGSSRPSSGNARSSGGSKGRH